MDLVKMFFEEMEGRVKEAKEALKMLISDPENYSLIEKAFRAIHTIKGSASLVGMSGFQRAFHKLEDVLKEWRRDLSLVNESSIMGMLNGLEFISSRKSFGEDDLKRLDNILRGKERVSKEVSAEISNSDEDFLRMLENIIDNLVELETHLKSGEVDLSEILVDILKKRLLRVYEKMKYVKLGKVLEGFDEMVLNDANDLGKKVKFILNVEGSMIEKEDASILRDSLVHLVRNAVVHGIETPNIRKKAGKDERGIVGINSFIENGEIVVEVFDDGKGIDIEKVKMKAKELGIEFSDPMELLFYPEFSTRDEIDEKGGRGVGLDAVKEFVEGRGGNISVETYPGMGTKFTLRIPLRRYLKRCLILRRNKAIFALRADDIDEVISVRSIYSKGSEMYVFHEENLYRVVDFHSGQFRFAILSKGKAIAADEILDIRDVPLKGSDIPIPFIVGFVIGVGKAPIPVIDPLKFERKVGIPGEEKKVLVVDDSPLTRLVVMRILEKAGYVAKGASSVKRALEMVKKEDFDYAIVDLELPDGNGIELLREVKKYIPKIRVAVLTTSDTLDNRLAAEEIGADAFLSKAEDIDRILTFMKGEL